MRINRLVPTGIVACLVVAGCSAAEGTEGQTLDVVTQPGEPTDTPAPTGNAPVDSDAEPDPWTAWSAEIQRLHAETESDFVRAILADGEITQEEVREAHHRYIECVNDAGFEVSRWETADGNMGMTSAYTLDTSSPEFVDVDMECHTRFLGWNPSIQSLWNLIRTNPGNLPREDAIAACWVRHELAPPGFTGQNYLEIMSGAAGELIHVTDDMTLEDIEAAQAAAGNPGERPYLPGWGYLDSDEHIACEINTAK